MTSQGMNGTVVLNSGDVYIGKVPGEPYGYKRNLRVTVDVRMERLNRRPAYETTTHEMVTEPLDFAITTGVWQPSGRDIVSGGATVEPLHELTSLAPGVTPEMVAELIDMAAWHLNAMQAGCVHQEPRYRKNPRYGNTEIDLDNTPACPETGYRYGHAWLVHELPEGFEERVRAALPA